MLSPAREGATGRALQVPPGASAEPAGLGGLDRLALSARCQKLETGGMGSQVRLHWWWEGVWRRRLPWMSWHWAKDAEGSLDKSLVPIPHE